MRVKVKSEEELKDLDSWYKFANFRMFKWAGEFIDVIECKREQYDFRCNNWSWKYEWLELIEIENNDELEQAAWESEQEEYEAVYGLNEEQMDYLKNMYFKMINPTIAFGEITDIKPTLRRKPIGINKDLDKL